jgi:hypothetical protein
MITRTIRSQRTAACFAVFAVLSTAGGCQKPAARPALTGARVDLMMAAYPDLRNGRFAVIADFERPEHMELFRLTATSPAARFAYDQQRGRRKTGTGCLLFTRGTDDDTLIISDANANNWHLKRNWQPFDMLLMSVFAPQNGLRMQTIISGGRGADGHASGATIPLSAGWNVARIDLAAMADHIPLDDVREIKLAVVGSDRPMTIALDDITVTSVRHDLFGNSDARDGSLYVQQIGRRWRVGAATDEHGFELTFANGQIVAWHDPAGDPHRLRNFVRGAKLGPTPVVVGSEGASERDFMRLGPTVVAKSRIMEMNPVRVVVNSDWRFVVDPQTPSEALGARPFQRWVYHIYASGQVYVSVEATAGSPTWTPSELGLALTLASSPSNGFAIKLIDPAEITLNPSGAAFATARLKESDTFLLYGVRTEGVATQMRDASVFTAGGDAPSELLSLVATANRQAGSVTSWSCHLMFGASNSTSPAEALQRAVAYAAPIPPRIEMDGLAPQQDGTVPPVEFDPVSGCFSITANGDRVRFTLDGSRQAYFAPTFHIRDAQRRKAWVYVDDEIIRSVARDAEGHIIIQLPEAVRDESVVEVLFQAPDASNLP